MHDFRIPVPHSPRKEPIGEKREIALLQGEKNIHNEDYVPKKKAP